ncbi:MAG: 16S rRNA (uracil(1498)-N(3))-methyltransferase [Arenibacterium sp.]
MSGKIRLYVDHSLGEGQSVPLTRDQAHYLFGVMRRGTGESVFLFNGRDGEWRTDIVETGKRSGVLSVVEQTAPLRLPPDLWLIFAPIKKARTDFIVEKAAELGAARILPIQTEFTNSERIRQDRLQAHAVEAAEQCGGTFVPEVTGLQKLGALLDTWPQERALMFCDELTVDDRVDASPLPGPPAAILIGPEGGFSESERKRLRGMNQTRVVSLGPRVLRADTAAVAAVTLWQKAKGDWS